jgi:hypothetical protein
VRAQKRRTATVAATNQLIADLQQKVGTNPFSLAGLAGVDGDGKTPANMAFARIVQRFKKDYFAVADKHSKVMTAATRDAILRAIEVELQ